MNGRMKLKAGVALGVLTTACVLGAGAQETRESAISHMRKVDAKEMDASYKKTAPFAQRLVDDALAKHSEVLLLAIHAGAPKYDIVASNFGRMGKLGDEDDRRCIRTGKDNLEVNKEGNHFEAEIALKDKAGKTVGALAAVFHYSAGADRAAMQKIAHEIEAEMQAQLPDGGRLFGPA